MRCEIWLNDTPFHFSHGIIHYEDGRIRFLDSTVKQTATGAECLILREEDSISEEYLFSWYFKFGVLEPEYWDSSISQITFHNEGKQDLYIWRYVYLRSGADTTIDYLDTQHHTLLQTFRPLGMGTLLLTTSTDADVQAFLKKQGLILYKHTIPDSQTLRVRFIESSFVREVKSGDPGFETSSGELSLDEEHRVVLKTKHSNYVFSLDYRRGE